MPQRKNLERPLHISIASSMKEAISDGRLAVDERLPPHRTLADALGVSVHTVSKAYDELMRQGLIGSHVGRGTFVLDATQGSLQPFLMERGERGLIDLSIARPLYDQIHVDEMQAALFELSKAASPDVFLACRPNVGLESHRRSGVRWLAECGMKVEPKSIVMTNGVCHGMSTALAAIARPGDVVVTDKIAHHLIISLCAYLGLRLQGLDMDEEGVLPEAFEAACKNQDIRVFFTVPTLANPAASLMSEERREALAKIAQKYDVLIIEDDVLGPMPEARLRPLSSFAPERSIYLTSFTKCVIPGLRAGYLVAPDYLLPAITGRLIVFSWMATPLMCELASRWVEDGTAQKLMLWQREKIAERYSIAQEELAGLDWSGESASLHFWLRLPPEWDARAVVEHAKALGVAITSPDSFRTAQSGSINGVRIAVGSVSNPDRYRHGLQLIRELLKRIPEPLPQFV